MIVFEKIIITNFMSVGNAPLEINYNQHKTTLVTATNGTGKSSIMMDSICFALYGKPYRNINKPQLVNSINGKNCLVELHFKVNRTKYVIKRGIKPVVFEIYKSGKLLNQDAAAKDYQKILETNILKMNFRTFSQVVIMGSGNYVPFMRLRANDRREFIEDVLDIRIFSLMNQLLKQHIKDTDESETNARRSIDLLKEKFQMQESFIKKLESEKESRHSELQSKVDGLRIEADTLGETIKSLSESAESIESAPEELSNTNSKIRELKSLQSKLNGLIEKNNEDKKFYATLDMCPTCHQEINDTHRSSIISEVDNKLGEFSTALTAIDDKMSEVNTKLKAVEGQQRELMSIQSQISTAQTSLAGTLRMITQYQTELTDHVSDSSSVDEERKKLKKISKEIVAKADERKGFVIQKKYNEATASLLKDTGIKTKIIKQYIPVFNKLINAYLQHLDLFVSFELDENFNETVKSRYRDAFTYDSFSEGEKQRIDLAMLFTFRDIARMKNAINVNILICDEILDQSLDSVGVDNFFNIIGGLSNTNLFVISHRENMQDKFDSGLKLTKSNNFTVLSED